MIFDNLIKYWTDYGYDILVILSILFLCVYAVVRVGKRGSWSFDTYVAPVSVSNKKKRSNDSKGETICRNYLEKRFGVSFSKARPDFLRNEVTGTRNLELDCYNDKLKLALEYRGAQHDRHISHFHPTKDAFYNQKYRDFMKKVLCEKNNITLIEISHTIKEKDIEEELERKLIQSGF